MEACCAIASDEALAQTAATRPKSRRRGIGWERWTGIGRCAARGNMSVSQAGGNECGRRVRLPEVNEVWCEHAKCRVGHGNNADEAIPARGRDDGARCLCERVGQA